MTERTNEGRDLEIVRLYEQGRTLQSLSKEYSVTHERIRQILIDNRVEIRGPGRPKKK